MDDNDFSRRGQKNPLIFVTPTLDWPSMPAQSVPPHSSALHGIFIVKIA
jgi:hypothetical protein